MNHNLFATERTLGDGIDSSLLKVSEKARPTFTPIEPTTKIFTLKPVYVSKERKTPKCLIKKPREPKFIPYEPYKAAVEPIVPLKIPIVKPSRNNVAIQELVAQMAEMRAAELDKEEEEPGADSLISVKQWEKEKEAYETDIKNLRETNAHLENQIKFQTQVNSELKTLLVAAVGEDLESRVQHLTEDKLQLARALLNSANHLTSHQERMEWLSGQCEVWRSKFLASSLMVEELARWKSALGSRVNDLQNNIKSLLEEQYKLRKKSLKTCCFLQQIIQKQSSNQHEEPIRTANSNDLVNANLIISEKLCDLMECDKGTYDDLYRQYLKLPQETFVEKAAIKVLQNPVTVSNNQDVVYNALRGTAAMSLSTNQMFKGHSISQAHCCAHCTGEVKDI